MASEIEKITFSPKNGEKRMEITWGRSLSVKVKKCIVRLFKGLLTTLTQALPATALAPEWQNPPPRRDSRTSELSQEFPKSHFTTHL